MSFIPASFDTLLRQASMSADEYMCEAERCIDARFGDGYAAAHPQLVMMFMQVAAADYAHNCWIKFLDESGTLSQALGLLNTLRDESAYRP